MDFKELTEQYQELKSTPETLDKTARRKNTVKGESADSKRKRQSMLPSEKEHHKLAESITPMFDTTKRAGAGGTRVGVPGIRPHGGKAASAFLENFTGTGRIEKEPEMFSKPVKIKDGRHLNAPQANVVIYDKCMDCMKPVRIDRCVPDMLVIPPAHLLNPMARDKWAAVGIHTGHILCYLFCVKCQKNAMDTARKLNAQGIDIVVCGQVVSAGQRYMRERGYRVSDNLYSYIKKERNNEYSDCFYGDAKTR